MTWSVGHSIPPILGARRRPIAMGMRRVSLRRRIGGIVVCGGVDLPIPVVLRWELPCIGRFCSWFAGGRKWREGAVEEEELLRHIGNASTWDWQLIDWGGVAGLDGSVCLLRPLALCFLRDVGTSPQRLDFVSASF